jgi:hypothetical protein
MIAASLLQIATGLGACALAACSSHDADPSRATGGIQLAGRAQIAGDALDLSGLTGVLEDKTAQNRLGAFGSAIAWTGNGEHYVTAVDRGPGDGSTTFQDRLELFEIHVDPSANPPLAVKLEKTTMLVDESGRPLVGAASAFDNEHPERGLRFDPEGIRPSREGTYFVSDEYGPWIAEFNLAGKLMRRLDVPPRFQVPHLAAENEDRLPENDHGRVANHGFEGLAITSDGARLFALLQGPLIQDHGREGVNCRLLEIELSTGRTRELCVALPSKAHSFNELLAIDDHRFLAIERDHEKGKKARDKKIVLLDVADASDVSSIESLPESGLPAGVKGVVKAAFLDMLEPRFGLAGETFPEKIEGLAFGPDLADGRHVLIVTSDNDYRADAPSWFWAFAIPAPLLPGFDVRSFAVRSPASGSDSTPK